MRTGGVLCCRLRGAETGTDKDSEPVTSAVVDPTEPVEKRLRLTGQQRVGFPSRNAVTLTRKRKSDGKSQYNFDAGSQAADL